MQDIAGMLKISNSIKLLVKMKDVSFILSKRLNGLFGQPNMSSRFEFIFWREIKYAGKKAGFLSFQPSITCFGKVGILKKDTLMGCMSDPCFQLDTGVTVATWVWWGERQRRGGRWREGRKEEGDQQSRRRCCSKQKQCPGSQVFLPIVR